MLCDPTMWFHSLNISFENSTKVIITPFNIRVRINTAEIIRIKFSCDTNQSRCQSTLLQFFNCPSFLIIRLIKRLKKLCHFIIMLAPFVNKVLQFLPQFVIKTALLSNSSIQHNWINLLQHSLRVDVLQRFCYVVQDIKSTLFKS